MKYYNHQDEADDAVICFTGHCMEAAYTNIATGKNLRVHSDELKGWPGVNAEAAVQLWMTAIGIRVVLLQECTVTSPEGLNYSQMINKPYMAVAYDF